MLSYPSAVAENQPINKHRMNKALSSLAARLRELISNRQSAVGDRQFSELALELFALQFQHNPAYRKISEARKLTPQNVEHWTQIPAVPTAAFKKLELSCIPPAERTAVFHSSGTTEQQPSRHFHCAESLALYETSLWNWFEPLILGDLKPQTSNFNLLCLTPPPAQAPRSSLVHMFETIRRKLGLPEPVFIGRIDADGTWSLNFDAAVPMLTSSRANQHPALILGTAFSFVHLLDFLTEKSLSFTLPAGSRVMETGGYKNRSRVLAKAELHALMAGRFGVPRGHIICEYGMSELSSQAYEREVASQKSEVGCFHFPPWARARIISPETGREAAEGEAGLIRVLDLANVFSVAAIQTEDLGIRRGGGFELLGRAPQAEPRGCSLMSA